SVDARKFSIRVADEAEARAALAHAVRLPLGLDALLGELGERRVEVVDADGDVPVGGSQLVGTAVVVVGQLEHVSRSRQSSRSSSSPPARRSMSISLEKRKPSASQKARLFAGSVIRTIVWRKVAMPRILGACPSQTLR